MFTAQGIGSSRDLRVLVGLNLEASLVVSRVSPRLRGLGNQALADENDLPKGCCCCSDERSFSLRGLTDKEYVERRNKSKKDLHSYGFVCRSSTVCQLSI